MNKVLRNLKNTLISALIVVSVLSAVVLAISLLTGTWYYEKFQSSTWKIISTYYLGALIVSLITGPLMAFARFAPVAVLLGMLGGCAMYTLVAFSIGGEVNLGIALGLGVIIGGPVGYFIWSGLNEDRINAKKQIVQPPPIILAPTDRHTFTQEDSVLLYGSAAEVDAWSGTDACPGVDHRATEEEVVREFANFLPHGFLSCKWLSHHPLLLQLDAGEKVVAIRMEEEPGNCWRTLVHITRLLKPEYEIKVFKATLGDDTHTFLLRTSNWWRDYQSRFPERYETFFDELEAILPGWGIEIQDSETA